MGAQLDKKTLAEIALWSRLTRGWPGTASLQPSSLPPLRPLRLTDLTLRLQRE
jgi:hypothetical protein